MSNEQADEDGSEPQIGCNIAMIRKMIGFDYNPSATPPQSYLKNRIQTEVSVKRNRQPKKLKEEPVKKRRSLRNTKVEEPKGTKIKIKMFTQLSTATKPIKVKPSTITKPVQQPRRDSLSVSDFCDKVLALNNERDQLVDQIKEYCGFGASGEKGTCLYRVLDYNDEEGVTCLE
ncbi:hypothetical protein PPYR_05888 [Photinus pyralis]|uniref:Uncharacterized protein n=2 Tax=Photinus pyralis TaxID=7054 RepID=A0A5N4AW23_PHOPY|nr:hypothetical protein PPYR_05888 [Photinus pyralis]